MSRVLASPLRLRPIWLYTTILLSTNRTNRIPNASDSFLIQNTFYSPSSLLRRSDDGIPRAIVRSISQSPFMLVSNSVDCNPNICTNGELEEEEKETGEDGIDNDNENKLVLPFVETSHNSVTITIPSDRTEENDLFHPQHFSTSLANTMTTLRRLRKSSIWLEVPMSRARLIEDIEAANVGFHFHHAEGSTATLNAWLREDIPSKVPEFATHHVGVGAVVINNRDEILCLRELRKNYHPWKIPTGLAELGESIHEAAEREVFEETGIAATCHHVLSFRHSHEMAHGRSDLFFMCRLIPNKKEDDDDDNNIRTPIPQACEIAEATWLPLSEYREMIEGRTEESKGHPTMSFVMNEMFDKGRGINRREVKSVIPGRSPTALYFPDNKIQ